MKRRQVLRAGMRASIMASGAGLLTSQLSGSDAKASSLSHLFVPAEEAPNERTLMQWPVNRSVHSDPVFLDQLQQTIADIANTISEFEPVVMLMDKMFQNSARQLLSQAVEIWNVPTDDLWCRDSGPLFAIQNDKLVVSHIQFNGWGNKQVHDNDGKIAQRVAEILDFPVIPSGLKGEAGGVEHDGHGLLMAHESSWLNDNRNPGLSRDQIEQALRDAYGAYRMIWSKGVWGEDITDYHIDSLARFTGNGQVLINLPEQPDLSDPFHKAAIETYHTLQRQGFTDGKNLTAIPEPNIRRVKSIDFVASYVNYYVCNGGVIAAQFGDQRTDEIAINALKQAYPGRDIIALNIDPLGEVGGGIHCATQQMPKI